MNKKCTWRIVREPKYIGMVICESDCKAERAWYANKYKYCFKCGKKINLIEDYKENDRE